MAHSDFLERMSRTQIYRDYEEAFLSATKLPLTLRPPETLGIVQRGRPNENPFCALLARSSKACAACLEIQEKIARGESREAASATCFAGLCDTAVPVRIGEELVGFLQTGQVALKEPSRERFRRIARQLVEWGAEVDLKKLEDAYFHSRVIEPEQYAGFVKLLEIFAGHLGAIGNQLLIQEKSAESPFSRRVKAYVADHQDDEISLQDVAQALHVSTFYFCKMFKKATGLTFTEYLGRVRVEKAKELLLDPNVRISEAAFEVGFGSLTHFNRLFKKVVGVSPTAYREQSGVRPAA